MDPLHREPADRYELILRPESATNPAGLEQEIADIIRAKLAQLGVARPPAEWAEPDPAERSSKAVAVEARVFHKIDEISTENAARVAARDHPPRPSLVRRVFGWLRARFARRTSTGTTAEVEAARRRIEAAVEKCVRDGVLPAAEVTTAVTVQAGE